MHIARKRMAQACLVLIALACASAVFADYGINLPEPVTPTARDIYSIHMTTASIVTVLFAAVIAVVGYSLYCHRQSRGFPPDRNLHKTWFGRWSWVLVPVLVLAVDLSIAGNAERVLENLWFVPKDAELMNVKVIGHQWWWEYQYPEYGVTVESRYLPESEAGDLYLRAVDHPLVLPVGRKIRFLHTSADVIHAFWVPELGMKKDAIAGYITETWAEIEKEGTYRGQCAELCGAWHARMPIVVEAVSEEQFARWVEEQKGNMLAAEEAASDRVWQAEELMEKGRAWYNTNCSACHQLGGEGLPPTFPALKGSKIATGPLADHIRLVLNGKPGTAMPAFNSLSNLEIAAIITYERNAWGNGTGDAVQPADVAAAR